MPQLMPYFLGEQFIFEQKFNFSKSMFSFKIDVFVKLS